MFSSVLDGLFGTSSPSPSMANFRTLFFAGIVFPAASGTTAKGQTIKINEEEQTAMQELVLDLFEPYGDIDFFFFDIHTGAGVVTFRTGKSGESCYLMSHLLPISVKESHKNHQLKRGQEKSQVSFPHHENVDQTQTNNNNINNNNNTTSSSATSTGGGSSNNNMTFSLVCLEFACVLPIASSASLSLLGSSAEAWASTSRKTLYSLEQLQQPPHHNNTAHHDAADDDDDSKDVKLKKKKQEKETWMLHLEFMSAQQRQRRSLLQSVAQLRDLLVVDAEKFELSPAASAELQAQVEEHMSSLLPSPQQAAVPYLHQQQHSEDDESEHHHQLLGIDTQSDFWQNVVIPQCVDKILDDLCGIDSERAFISPPNSPSKKEASKKEDQERQGDNNTNNDDHAKKTHHLIQSIVHCSLSIVDVWHAIYKVFYVGDTARTLHASPAAMLEYKLKSSFTASSSTATTPSAAASVAAPSLRHPAWAAFMVKHPTEEARRRSDASLAVGRRSEIGKLFHSQLLPVHLGLKEWPGGPGDDVGSSLRAILAFLCAVRPLYQDSTLRHIWCSLVVVVVVVNVDDDFKNKKKKTTNNNSFLRGLASCDAALRKQFAGGSAEPLLDGAWNLLFRGLWRMESSFSLTVAYLASAAENDSMMDGADSSSNNKNRKKNGGSGSDSATDTQQVVLANTLRVLDTQPPLWPLCRPLDYSEIDWKMSRGVFANPRHVYDRLYSSSSSSSSSTTGSGVDDANDDSKKSNKNMLGRIRFTLREWSFEFVAGALSMFGHDPALLTSRYYYREASATGRALLAPVLCMMLLGAAMFVALRRGWVAPVQVWVYNLLTGGAFNFGDDVERSSS